MLELFSELTVFHIGAGIMFVVVVTQILYSISLQLKINKGKKRLQEIQ
jgi:hypothetical protein